VGAYSKLLSTMPDDKITISAICSAAGVGRQTFYRHFRNKKGVFTYQMDHGYDLYCEELRKYPPESLTIDVMLFEAFDFWKKHQAVLNPLAQSDELKFWFIERFTRIWRRIAREFLPASDSHQYDIEFQISGITGVFLHWLERDMKESPAEITDMIMTLLDDHDAKRGR
jgi:AcrR family transcriptional regulator